jgi:hypothetical protein
MSAHFDDHMNDKLKKLLGRILVGRYGIRPDNPGIARTGAYGLHLQQMFVAAALSALVSISAVGQVEAGPSGNVSSATVHVSATVKPVAKVTVLYQLPQLEITSQNIAQGYLEIPNASRLEVRSNSPSGYLLSIENQGGPFRDVIVSGLGGEVQLNRGTGWILMPYAPMPNTMEVSYRIMLADDARPGFYPWPFQLSAMII